MATTLATGLWRADLAHSFIWFSVPHLGISRVRGRFREFVASYEVGTDGSWERWTFDVKAASIDTNDVDRDNLLRSMDYFDVVSHPTHRFVSTSIDHRSDREYEVLGNLTMNGLTHPVRFDAQVSAASAERRRQRVGFVAISAVSRTAFGLAAPDPETAKLPDADLVDVGVEVEALPAHP